MRSRFASLALVVCGLVSLTGFAVASEIQAERVALEKWMAGLQYTDPSLPSFGAIRVYSTDSAVDPKGGHYARVSPYFADLGLIGLLEASPTSGLPVAKRWIGWYLAHLTPESATDGVPYEHFYLSDGKGETVCLDPAKPNLCHYNDATDSAACTFFSVLGRYQKAGGDTALLKAAGVKEQLEKLAGVVLALQQPNGLCWAKQDYRVEYLEDNCEVFDGFRSLARIEQEVYRDPGKASFYTQVAARVKEGIFKVLYDPSTGLYRSTVPEKGPVPLPKLDLWYPDVQAQFWPVLLGVVSPDDPRAKTSLRLVNETWNGAAKPDWATHPEKVNNGWICSDVAYAAVLTGDRKQVTVYLDAVLNRIKTKRTGRAPYPWPFAVSDAGWLLLILQQTEKP